MTDAKLKIVAKSYLPPAESLVAPTLYFKIQDVSSLNDYRTMEAFVEDEPSSSGESVLGNSSLPWLDARFPVATSSLPAVDEILFPHSTSTWKNDVPWMAGANETDMEAVGEDTFPLYSADSNTGYLDNFLIAVPMGLCLYSLSVLTLIGNGMVLHAIRTERRLQTVSNMFIMSLAIADLTVGLFVMPISATYVLVGDWPFGLVVCQVWLSADYTASTSSILNLLILSLDRYWSVRSPLKYMRKRTKKRALLMIAVVWIVSGLWILPIIGWHWWANEGGRRKQPENVCETEFADNVLFKVTTSTANFYVPLLLMIGVYMKIYMEIKKRSRFEIGQCNVGGSAVTKSSTPTPLRSFSQKFTGRKGNKSANALRPCRYTEPSRFAEYQVCTPSSSSGLISDSSHQCERTLVDIQQHHASTHGFSFRRQLKNSRLKKSDQHSQWSSGAEKTDVKRKKLLLFPKPFAHRELERKSRSKKVDLLCAICSREPKDRPLNGSVENPAHFRSSGSTRLQDTCRFSNSSCSANTALKSDFIWRCDTCGRTLKNNQTTITEQNEKEETQDSSSKSHVLKDLRPYCQNCENREKRTKGKEDSLLVVDLPATTTLKTEDVVVLDDNAAERSVSTSSSVDTRGSKRKSSAELSCSCLPKKKKPEYFEAHIEEFDSSTADDSPLAVRKRNCVPGSPSRKQSSNSPGTTAAERPAEGNQDIAQHLQVPQQIFRSSSFSSIGSFRRSSGFFSNLSTLRKSTRRGRGSNSLRQEKKAARQLGVIMGAFVLCWIPYIVIFIVTACCDDCLNPTIHTVTIWLGYLNSTVNPLIYALCNANFKRAFWKMAGRVPTKGSPAPNTAGTAAAKARKAEAESMFA